MREVKSLCVCVFARECEGEAKRLQVCVRVCLTFHGTEITGNMRWQQKVELTRAVASVRGKGCGEGVAATLGGRGRGRREAQLGLSRFND